MADWYYTSGGAPQGPISDDDLTRLIRLGTIGAYDMLWKEGMSGWAAASTIPGLFPSGSTPPNPPPPLYSTESPLDSQRVVAGLCAIIIGSLGVHKFILGKTTTGLIMLLVSLLTCGIGAIAMHAIAIAEGIIFLTKSDADFYQTYIVEGRNWF